jgi:hypothetical protein
MESGDLRNSIKACILRSKLIDTELSKKAIYMDIHKYI